MRAKELPRIDSIFRKNKDGNYTASAFLLQHMLKRSVFLNKVQNESNDNDGSSFSLWEIARWVISNDPNLVQKYGPKPPNVEEIIENTQMRFKRKLVHLMDLGLIQKSGTRLQEKGMGTVDVYKYTEYGQLLAFIIEGLDHNGQPRSINNEIFDLLCLIFPLKEDSPASSILYSKFFRKCKDRGVFENITVLFREAVSSDIPFISIIDLFQYVLRFKFNDKERMIYFNNLFDETINELDSKTKELILCSLKLEIEDRMKEQAGYFEGFEKMRFTLRADFRKIALESFCIGCQQFFHIPFDLLEYRKKVRNSYNEFLELTTKCRRCGLDNGLILPNLI
jgi:hypothetical protein